LSSVAEWSSCFNLTASAKTVRNQTPRHCSRAGSRRHAGRLRHP